MCVRYVTLEHILPGHNRRRNFIHDLKTKIHNHATYKQSTQISTEHGVITSKPDLYWNTCLWFLTVLLPLVFNDFKTYIYTIYWPTKLTLSLLHEINNDFTVLFCFWFRCYFDFHTYILTFLFCHQSVVRYEQWRYILCPGYKRVAWLGGVFFSDDKIIRYLYIQSSHTSI